MKLGFILNNSLLKKIEILPGNKIIDIRIGKSNDNDVVLSNKYISKHHAKIQVDLSGNLYIVDLGSSNGTFINGKKFNIIYFRKRGFYIRLDFFTINKGTICTSQINYI